MMAPLPRLALVLLALLAPPAPAGVDWLLVHGEGPGVGRLTWDQIGQAYLGGHDWRLVDADLANDEPLASRLLVGTPGDNPAVAALGPTLGLQTGPDGLRLDDQPVPPRTGLVLVTDDPDGHGLLALFTGADAAGVWSCFTVPVDVSDRARKLVRDGHVVPFEGPRFDLSRVAVVRLDRDFMALRHAAGAELTGAAAEDAATVDRPAVALRIARGLEGWRFVLANHLHPDEELLSFVTDLLARHEPELERAEAFAEERDLDALIRSVHGRCEEVLGRHAQPQPLFVALLARPNGTNASTLGPDPVTGRPVVQLNLTRLAGEPGLEAIIAHESVHTLQTAPGPRLIDRAVHEGVATYLSQQIVPDTSEAVALMWTEDELAAARDHEQALLSAFRAVSQSTHQTDFTAFLVWGRHHVAAPEAPSRTGYWIGFRAARAWKAAHPDAPLGALLDTPSDEILAALDAE